MTQRDPDPYVLYTIVRRSLGMSGGKVGAQCQHAFDYLTREFEAFLLGASANTDTVRNINNFNAWRAGDEHAKVVLGASDDEFEIIKSEFPNERQGAVKTPRHFVVIDFGYTQVAPNTQTCLCLWPMRKSERTPTLKALKPL